MGLSEGAIATATYVGEALAGRIIEGWTCHTGWPEYRGLNVPSTEPVLALSSENDPWFQKQILRGDCATFIVAQSALRQSIVFRSPDPAASQHDLMWNMDARRLVLDFLVAASNAKRRGRASKRAAHAHLPNSERRRRRANLCLV